MPITDHTFSAEELDAAITATPALRETLLGSVRKLGYDPLSADDKQKFTTDTESRFAGAKTKELYDAIDAVALEAGGVQKLPNEKTGDFVKRVVSAFKHDATGRTEKIAELEKAIKDGTGDGTMRAQLEALQASDAQKTEQLTKAEKDNFDKDVLLEVRVALLPLKFDPSLKDSVRNVMVKQATDKIVGMATTETAADGTVRTVYLNPETKKVELGEKNQPADAAYLLGKELADILDTGVKGAGTGSTGGTTTKEGEPEAPATLPAEVKNRGQLGDHLKKLGFTVGSKAYDKEMDRLGKGLPAR